MWGKIIYTIKEKMENDKKNKRWFVALLKNDIPKRIYCDISFEIEECHSPLPQAPVKF